MGQGTKWKKEELDYLENSWGQSSIPAIAKNLGRSVDAVKIKAVRLGLGRHIHSGVRITFCQFCKAIGKSYSQAKSRYENAGLPIHYQKSIKKRYAMVDIDEFWEWAKDNKDIVDFNAFPEGTFGAEPEWAKEARRADYISRTKTTPWTAAEDNELRHLLNQYKYTYDEISQRLHRTEGAVKRRISTLDLPQRPVRREDAKWTDEEIAVLIQMRESGHHWEEIGRTLGRSALATRGKYERIQNPEYTKRYYRRQRESMKDCFQRLQCVHFVKTEGCRMKHTDCDTCPDYCRRQQDEKQDTGWVPIRDKNIFEKMEETK